METSEQAEMALRNERAARSVNAGHLIAVALGLVFVGANSGSLEPGPRVALVLAAVSVALVPVVAAVRVHVLRRENPWSRTVGIDRSVWIAIGVEAFAMALGLGVLQQTATAILVAWVACVVGFSLLLMAIWWAPGPAGLRAVGILLTGLAARRRSPCSPAWVRVRCCSLRRSWSASARFGWSGVCRHGDAGRGWPPRQTHARPTRPCLGGLARGGPRARGLQRHGCLTGGHHVPGTGVHDRHAAPGHRDPRGRFRVDRDGARAVGLPLR
jgi:hypothetical protein